MTVEGFIHSVVYEAAVRYFNTMVTTGMPWRVEKPLRDLLTVMQVTWDVP